MNVSELTREFIYHFRIQRIIEEKPKSGQKQVYIVLIDDTTYALKIIQNIDERIYREISIYEEFRDIDGIPNIVKIEEYGDSLVVIEEFIEGKDLNSIKDLYLGKSGTIIRLIFDIATILKPIWERRCVHRDLKPQNIIIKANGFPVVLDFGIARDLDDETITPTGFQPFTWTFGSPEQYFYKKDQISYRTDFFCLGIIAYYLFTGEYPFGKSKSAIAECFLQTQKYFDVGNKQMNTFLNEVLKYSVAERPRNVNQFLNYLTI